MPRRDATTLEQTTGGRIVAGLSKVAMVFRRSQWAASGQRSLTPTQSQILAVVAGASGPMGLKAVAERLAVTMATASEAVGALVGKGLLRKEADEADGRAVLLRLTARGTREAAKASDWPAAIVEAVDAMPGPERATLLRGVVGMIRTMQERGLVPTSRMCVECRYFRPNEYRGEARPHHCLYIDAPIGDADLRVDCAEMEPADDATRPRLWEVFVHGKPLDRHGPGSARPRAGASNSRRAVRTSPKGNSP
ncbi:MAG: winged helix-turn-helix transcriptional regulator [Phycisphaerales bacterium]|nr:winged helix-turn-helix transcriptional regulator [Phycisphaerales bacterium]